jgi:hypothetical protein
MRFASLARIFTPSILLIGSLAAYGQQGQPINPGQILPSTTNGDVLQTVGGVTAWGTPSGGGTPTGPAGGDLSGTFPDPLVSNLSGILRIPNAKMNQSFGTSVEVVGNSICTGTGASSAANSWVNVFYSKIGVGTLNQHCIAGALIADTLNFGLLNVNASNPLLNGSYNQQPFGSGLTIIYDSDNETGNTTAAWETAYQQTYIAAIVIAGSASDSWITPYNTGVSVTGTTVNDNFAQPLPAVETTTAGGTISYSGLITTGSPIYLVYPVFAPGDGGSFNVSIDGTVATDTITNSSTLANTPYGGTIILSAFSYAQTFAAARFPVAAGSHNIVINCVAPGTHGCGMAILAGAPANSTEWSIPTVAVSGTIRQLGDANATGTAAFNSINQSMVNLTSGDGFNTVFGDVRKYIPLSLNTPAMSGTDGFGPGAIVRTDITATAGSATITGAAPFTNLYKNMQAFCINGATASTTLYTTAVQFSTATPNTLILGAPLGVSGTVTCWFGWPGQIWQASTLPGLHPNNFGHELLARAFLGAFQPVTVPPVFNNFTTFNAGALLNCGGTIDCSFGTSPGGSSSTSPVKRVDMIGAAGQAADGLVEPFYTPDGNFAFGLASRAINHSVVIGYQNSAVNQNNNYVFPFEFNAQRGFTSLLPIKGTVLTQSQGETIASVASANLEINTLFLASTINLAANSNLYTPVGASEQQLTLNFCQNATPRTVTPQTGVIGLTSTTAGSGQTNGTYPVNAVGGGGTGATASVIIAGGTLAGSTVTNFGTGYTSPPTFTVSAGGVSTVLAGVISAPVIGFYFNNGGKVDQTANACSTQSYQYVPSKTAWYANGYLPSVGTTAAASNCNQGGVLTSVAGCLIETIGGATHYVPYF